MTNICPMCGSVTFKPPLILGIIGPRIFDYIRRYPGCDIRAIMDYAYRDDFNGGPGSDRALSGHINTINKRIKDQGIKIVSAKGRGVSHYRIVQIKDVK